eukprot:1785193-Amphidinium_carterae.1
MGMVKTCFHCVGELSGESTFLAKGMVAVDPLLGNQIRVFRSAIKVSWSTEAWSLYVNQAVPGVDAVQDFSVPRAPPLLNTQTAVALSMRCARIFVTNECTRVTAFNTGTSSMDGAEQKRRMKALKEKTLHNHKELLVRKACKSLTNRVHQPHPIVVLRPGPWKALGIETCPARERQHCDGRQRLGERGKSFSFSNNPRIIFLFRVSPEAEPETWDNTIVPEDPESLGAPI